MKKVAIGGSIAAVLFVAGGCSPSSVGGAPPSAEPERPIVLTQSVEVEPAEIRSFRIESSAVVESNEGFESTKLTVSVTKLTNSVQRSLGVRVDFGDVVCESRRPYLVTNADQLGGGLFAGDEGFHELRCLPFTLATGFSDFPPGEVSTW